MRRIVSILILCAASAHADLLSAYWALSAPQAQSGAFSPSDISGLKTWFRYDTLTNVYADGAAVFSWPDSSGNGNYATQTTANANNPTYRTNGVNGRPAVYFLGDTASDLKRCLYQTNAITIPQPTTIIAVFCVTQWSPVTIDNGLIDSIDSTKRQILGYEHNGLPGFKQYAGTWTNAVARTTNAPSFVTAVYNGANSRLSTNGVDWVATGTAGTNSLGRLLLGQFNGYIGPKWYLSEVLVYDSALTGAQQTNINAYIANKYGF